MDPPLADPGEAISFGARVAMLGMARVWTSPARRRQALAAASQLPVQADPRLLELDFGSWEGSVGRGAARRLGPLGSRSAGFCAPGGESGADLIARVQSALAAIRTAGEDCAIVSHGGPLLVLAQPVQGKPSDLLASPPPTGSVQVLTA